MFKEYLFIYIFSFLLYFKVYSYTAASPTWMVSPYFRAGNNKVIQTKTGNSSKPTYVFTFSSALSGVPNLAYGIKNYRGLDTLKNQNFEVRRQNLTASNFNVSMQIFGVTNIFLMSVPYLAIDPAFPHHLNSFDNVPLNYDSTLINLTTSSLSATYFTEVINYTQQSSANKFKTFAMPLSSNKIVLFLTSFGVLSGGNYPLQFTINYTLLNSSHYQWTARVFCNATVSKVHFSQIVYNQDDVTASKTYAIVYQQWVVSQAGGIQSFPQQLTDNMILAVTDWQCTLGGCGFQYNWEFVTNYSGISFGIIMNASSPSHTYAYNSTSPCGFNYSRSTMFYIKTWKCGIPYIYFNLTTDLCQDACANYYYQNTTAATCDACYYSCIDCSKGKDPTACTQCQTTLNRTLVNGTCICSSGQFFDDGYSPTCRACSLVDSHCLTCTYSLDSTETTSYYQTIFSSATWKTDILPNFTCTVCAATYFLNSSRLCQTCSLNYCLTCKNLTACQTCNSAVNATKYTDNLCYLCNVANCTLCSSTNYCVQCVAGYTLSVGICQSCSEACNCGGWVLPQINGTCSTLCGDGIKIGTEQCDDGNIIDHDGCSSTCLSQACNVSCSCNGWVPPWANSSCSTLCGDNFTRGYQQCDDGNIIDHDGCSSNCLTEVCNVSCLCDGYTYPWVNGSCSTVCGDALVRGNQQCDDGNLIDRDGCSSLCQNQVCSVSCICDGYVLPQTNGSCSTLCGDSLTRGAQQCDDGNTNDHDGCSSICTLQACNVSCACNGWTHPWSNESCTSICGDGLMRRTEQCDDSNLIDHDGCSSICEDQPCNISCICDDGWIQPWLNGSCSTVCGDNIIRGIQQCDDGNIDDHDGCSSTCLAEACNISCLCDGYTSPWINGSCSTICGDGLIRGNQQCDDTNLNENDTCANNCTLLHITPTTIPTSEPSVLLSSRQTAYPALILFLLGFKIVGLQALNVFQNFQLLLNSQQVDSFILSFNVHGYTNTDNFPLDIPIQNHIFTKFNYMYLMLMFLFIIGAGLELYHKSCYKNNKVVNVQDNKQSELSDQKNNKINQVGSSQSHSDDMGDFTVHYNNHEDIRHLQSAKSVCNPNQQSQSGIIQPLQQPFWGSIVFRQIFFDLIVNCLYIFIYSFVTQLKDTPTSSFLNFPTLVAVISTFFMITLILAMCTVQNIGFGENNLKFNVNKPIIYWILIFSQKIIFSSLIAANTQWGIYAILAIKLILVIYYCIATLYYEPIQKFRSVITHILHFCLILTFILNQKYFKPHSILTESSPLLIEYVYAGFLGTVLLLSLGFYVRQMMNQCSADFRKKQETGLRLVTVNGTGSAIFDIKNDVMEDSANAFNSTMKSSNIFDDLKTKKIIPKSSAHLQLPSQNSHLGGSAIAKKVISINYINYLNSPSTSSHHQPSIKSKQTFQTHKRSHLKTKKMNIFDNDGYELSDQLNFKQIQNNQGSEYQNLDKLVYKPEQKRVSIQQDVNQVDRFKNQNLVATKTKGFARSLRRIGKKNKQNKQEDNKKIVKTQQKQEPSASQLKKFQQIAPVLGFSTIQNVFEQPKRQNRPRTFFHKRAQARNARKGDKQEQKADQQAFYDKPSIQHHQQFVDNYDAVSINFQ